MGGGGGGGGGADPEDSSHIGKHIHGERHLYIRLVYR